jgi:hypothetical protein
MKKIIIFQLFCFIALFSFAQTSPVTFKAVMDDDENASDKVVKGKLYIVCDKKQVLVADLTEVPAELSSDYAKRKPNELDKMQTWWAGGSVYTLTYKNNKFSVLKGYIPDEGDVALVDEKVIKTISISMLTANAKVLDGAIKKYLVAANKKK